MARQDVREAEAQAIVDSIMRWWWTDDQGTTRGRHSSTSGTGGFDGCVDPPLTIATGSLGLDEVANEPAPATSRLLPALFLAADPAI